MRYLVTLVGLALLTNEQAAAQRPDPENQRVYECGRTGTTNPAEGRDYPFNLERIRFALKRFKSPMTERVSVLVVDNGFAGWISDPSGYRPSVNFPNAFFYSKDGQPRPTTDRIDTGPKEEAWRWGHGTHVTGLVLGGMYGSREPIAGDLGTPEVRELFFDDLLNGRGVPDAGEPRGWLKVFVYPLKTNDNDWDDGKLVKLGADDIKADVPSFRPDIINMSLAYSPQRTEGSYVASAKSLPDRFGDALLVASAGNAGRQLSESDGPFPAMSTTGRGNLIVVGSHNSDLKPSIFSNYDPHSVTLAAPGCGLKSWVSGETTVAEPENGTSQSAAIVTFAAALLKSRWIDATANQLRERLIVSSRYSRALAGGCKNKDTGEKVACALWGNALDIEMALYFDIDAVEYCAKPGTTAFENCATRIALGKLVEVPPEINACANATRPARSEIGALSPVLTSPSAIRALDSGSHEVLYRARGGLDGQTFAQHACGKAAPGSFKFDVIGSDVDQPSKPLGTKPFNVDERLNLDASRVVRIVTRSYKLAGGSP